MAQLPLSRLLAPPRQVRTGFWLSPAAASVLALQLAAGATSDGSHLTLVARIRNGGRVAASVRVDRSTGRAEACSALVCGDSEQWHYSAWGAGPAPGRVVHSASAGGTNTFVTDGFRFGAGLPPGARRMGGPGPLRRFPRCSRKTQGLSGRRGSPPRAAVTPL